MVSQDLDIGVPVDRHAALKERLGDLHDFQPSTDEPSVWTPRAAELLELNFIGMDPSQDPAEAYVFADDRLPLDTLYARLRPELRHAVRSNLTILSLLAPRPGMPDPQPRRADVAALLRRFEASETEAP